MIPYVQIKKNNKKFDCASDLVILHKGTPLLISLTDIHIKNKKICADLINKDCFCEFGLKDRDNISFYKHLYTYNIKFKYKNDKIDNIFTHTLVYNTNISDYIIDWNNDGIIKCITNYLHNKEYLPVTEEIVELIYNKCKYKDSMLETCDVYTNNPDFKDLKVYKLNIYWFKTELKSLNLSSGESDFNWDSIEDIEDYIFTFMNPIKEKLKENITVLYNPNKINQEVFEGNIKPYDGQVPIIQSGIEVLNKDRFIYLACEQGIGKTTMASKITHAYYKSKNKNNYTCLVLAPTITITQWKEELKKSIGDDIDIIIIKKTIDFIKWYNENNYSLKVEKPTFFIVGKETFKLSSKKRPGILKFKRNIRVKEYNYWGFPKEVDKTIEVCICPDCGKPLLNPLRKDKMKEESFLQSKDFKGNPKKSTYKCFRCNNILWQDTYDKTKKTSLINFIKVKNLMFNVVIQDEVHQSNNGSSIIGNASKTLLNHGKKHVLLSGTSNNGYASSLYNLLSGLIPNTLIKDNIDSQEKFVKTYGTLMAVTKKKDGEYYSRGRSEIRDSDWVETEGINPIVFTKYLASNYIFATLDDLGKDLPKLEERYIGIDHLDEIVNNESKLLNDIKSANAFNLKMYEDSIVRHYVNNPYNWNSMIVKQGEIVKEVQPINLKENVILPKEKELLKIIKQEISENRKVWIYTDFTGESGNGQYMIGENIPERLKNYLESNDIKVYWLKPSVKPIDRKKVIEKNKDKYDVFISNPKLVEVGINMVWCSTYIIYIPSYNVNTIQQAIRRGYRANAIQDNRIYHLYYSNTIENKICKRFQKKTVESQAIEGKFNINIEDEEIRTASALSKKINDSI